MTKPTMIFPDAMWAGTENSLEIARVGYELMMADQLAGIVTTGGQQQSEEPEVPYNYSLQGDIGVITVRGSLINADNPYARYRGMTTYPDIRRAMIHGALDPKASHLLLDIESGGGAVNGVSDTGNLISTINDSVKPVTAFTDGLMASAAYWLGSSAGDVYSSKTSVVGSIGVISTHMEVSKAMKDAGIGVTVMRAGEYKALANMHEPLTDTAKTQIQNQLNAAYGVFAGHVADRRSVSMDTFDKSMGQGREFFGEAAQTAGLVDGIASYDKVVSKINSAIIDKKAQYDQNVSHLHGRNQQVKAALTEQQLAAIAAGATLESVLPGVDAAALAEAQAQVDADAKKKAEDEAAAKAQADAAAAAAAAAQAAAQTTIDAGVVNLLQSQLAAAQAAIVDLKVELNTKSAALEASSKHTPALNAIVQKSIAHMRVALRQPAIDMSGYSQEALLAEHTTMSDQFTKTFKAGGVAAVVPPKAAEDTRADLGKHQQAVAAVRGQRK